jgi:5-bromo-4-chloroindolyl phosphate hydrolysis protein
MEFLSKNANFQIFNNENVIVAVFIHSFLCFNNNYVINFIYNNVNTALKFYINVKSSTQEFYIKKNIKIKNPL